MALQSNRVEVSCPHSSRLFEEAFSRSALTTLQGFDLGQSFVKMEQAGGDGDDLRGQATHHLNTNRRSQPSFNGNKS